MGQYLSSPATEKFTDYGTHHRFEYGVASHQGWRKHMEDAHCVHITEDDVCIFGVFDGHGGAEVAKFTAKYLPVEILRTRAFQEGDYASSLIDAFHQMDDLLPHNIEELIQLRQPEEDIEVEEENGDETDKERGDAFDMLRKLLVLQKMIKNGDENNTNEPITADGHVDNISNDTGPKLSSLASTKPAVAADMEMNAGCTAVVALLTSEDQLYVANAGDSRAVLCRSGSALELSRDHKPGDPSERERIVAAGGFLTEMGCIKRVCGNLALSRAIGDLKYKMNADLHRSEQIITAEPDIQQIKIIPEDSFLVLACDGIWDVKSSQEVVDFIKSGLAAGQTTTEVASDLLNACLATDPREARGIGADNMTCAIMLFKERPASNGRASEQGQKEKQHEDTSTLVPNGTAALEAKDNVQPSDEVRNNKA